LRAEPFLAFKGKPVDRAVSELTTILGMNADKNQFRANVLSVLFAVSALALLWSIIAWVVVID